MSKQESGPRPTCIVSECSRESHTKGLCPAHYQKHLRYGTATPSPDQRRKPGPKPDPSKPRSRHNPDNPNRLRPRKQRTERTQCKRGHKLTEDSVYLSKAGVRSCRECLRENTARWRELHPVEKVGNSNQRKTHCKRGHEFTPENTYEYKGNRQCKACMRAHGKRHQDEVGRFQRYGITKQDYEEMLARQGNACAICSDPLNGYRNLHIDHDHVTGQVRGVLCRSCNLALGKFRDDPDLLIKAADYLRTFVVTTP